MQAGSARAQSVADTRDRLLDVAVEVLGRNPDAGMGEIATAAGVVRRTVYGHFPTRDDLVRTLAQRAVDEMVVVLAEAADAAPAPDAVWADFVARLWPLAHRYRVLLALRRGEFGEQIHALLRPVDDVLADVVRHGQDDGSFGRHLPPELLSQIALAAVFAVADDRSHAPLDERAAAVTSLLLLGVPEAHARALVDDRS